MGTTLLKRFKHRDTVNDLNQTARDLMKLNRQQEVQKMMKTLIVSSFYSYSDSTGRGVFQTKTKKGLFVLNTDIIPVGLIWAACGLLLLKNHQMMCKSVYFN